MASHRYSEREWFERALVALRDSGPTGQASAEYIEGRRVPLGFSHQKSTGAAWFDWRRLRFGIFMNSRYIDQRPDLPQMYALLAHEAKHLEQGVLEALSVRGELEAWQLQYDVLWESSAAPDDPLWLDLRALDKNLRVDLGRARNLMRQIAGPAYRIHWLPYYRLSDEIVYWVARLRR